MKDALDAQDLPPLRDANLPLDEDVRAVAFEERAVLVRPTGNRVPVLAVNLQHHLASLCGPQPSHSRYSDTDRPRQQEANQG
jgi:hypothetical protein